VFCSLLGDVVSLCSHVIFEQLLGHFEQFTILKMGEEDEDSPRKEGKNLWLETWIEIVRIFFSLPPSLFPSSIK